ncbi:hypothetical protein KAR91_34660 [Candidatus Pacearchaeota archaeon]|nr:hypothetical protein [Candidatus Pacearchaeota archaeon]
MLMGPAGRELWKQLHHAENYGTKIQFNAAEKFYNDFYKVYPSGIAWDTPLRSYKREVNEMKDMKTRIYPISARKPATDQKTITAIEGTVKKWQNIMAGGVDEGYNNCPLCEEFYRCLECPIKAKTGEVECDKTPYRDWVSHWERKHRKGDITKEKTIRCSICAGLAYQELDFLENLLKKHKEKGVEKLPGMLYYGGDHLDIKSKYSSDLHVLGFAGIEKAYLINLRDGCHFGPVDAPGVAGITEERFDKFFTSDIEYKVTLVKPSSRRP